MQVLRSIVNDSTATGFCFAAQPHQFEAAFRQWLAAHNVTLFTGMLLTSAQLAANRIGELVFNASFVVQAKVGFPIALFLSLFLRF
jgi:hypothetical protein